MAGLQHPDRYSTDFEAADSLMVSVRQRINTQFTVLRYVRMDQLESVRNVRRVSGQWPAGALHRRSRVAIPFEYWRRLLLFRRPWNIS